MGVSRKLPEWIWGIPEEVSEAAGAAGLTGPVLSLVVVARFSLDFCFSLQYLTLVHQLLA